MESLEKKLSLVVIFVFFSLSIFAQNSLFAPNSKISIKMWSLLEGNPLAQKTTNANEEFYSSSVRKIKKIAPYVFEGMIFGFDFDYVPLDKTRNVQEFFSVDFSRSNYTNHKDFVKQISYRNPYFEDDCLICWADFSLTSDISLRLSQRNSVMLKKACGKGCGKLIDSEKGIQDAFENAIKNAVRSYAQTISKNKPKEIRGTVIINKEPRIYIQHGQYIVDVEFLIEKLDIQNYTTF